MNEFTVVESWDYKQTSSGINNRRFKLILTLVQVNLFAVCSMAYTQ